MTVDITLTAGLRRLVSVPLTTTDVVEVFEAADTNSTLLSASIVNETSTATVVSLFWLDSTVPVSNLIYRRSIDADDTDFIQDLPVRLRTEDKITAQADTGNALTVNLVIADSFNYRPESMSK